MVDFFVLYNTRFALVGTKELTFQNLIEYAMITDGAFKNSIMQAAELEGTLRLKSVFAIDVKVGAENIANSHTDLLPSNKHVKNNHRQPKLSVGGNTSNVIFKNT